MSVQLIVRVDDELKEKVSQLARVEGKNMSQLVRELLQKYARERDAKSHIDLLWNNIGGSLKQADARQKDIEQAIKAVRQKS